MVDIGGGMGQFSQIGGDLLNRVIYGGAAVVGIIILAAVIVGVGFYVRYLRKFNIKVEIKSLRSSGILGRETYKIIEDRGGIIQNKRDKTSWFRLMREKVDLPSPPLECFELDAKGTNHIKILQKSENEYYYLLPDRVDTSVIIRAGAEIPIAQSGLKVIEGDVSYWGQLRKRENKKIFDTEGIIMKLLPFIVPTLMFVLVIFLTYLITDHWGEFASAAQALERAANALRDVSQASTVTGTG